MITVPCCFICLFLFPSASRWELFILLDHFSRCGRLQAMHTEAWHMCCLYLVQFGVSDSPRSVHVLCLSVLWKLKRQTLVTTVLLQERTTHW